MFSRIQKLPTLLRSRIVLSPPEQDEDGRVLQLFRNRAELKKAYGNAQDEIHRLRDRIKLQEGATARVRDTLKGLESRLAQPTLGLQALIHYQLRALWEAAHERVSILVRELSAQCEDRERREFTARLGQRRSGAMQTAQQQWEQAERNSAEVAEKLAELEQQLEANRLWWRYFARRQLQHRQPVLLSEKRLADADLDAAREAMAAFERSDEPEFPGLSLESRRAINMAAIAFAMLIHSRLAGGGLLELAAEAMSRSEPCDLGNVQGVAILTMMSDITRARQTVQSCAAAIAEVRKITDQLRVVARYRNREDSVPEADSLDRMSRAAPSTAADAPALAAVPTAAPINALRGDLFGISDLLL
ncbi:MAG: hypothetical protein LBE59_03590 [Nevskiaceae bacterium]|nr:hypothetical protein [Nevskiaceae bacterium]